ncbi:MAG TPA: lamin tail domain-containing protein [Flexilinea sp.]|nr:lamin tail domain-containing protein [Flexilinea sp.]
MKTFWKILILLLVNVIVSVTATFAVLYYWENIRNAEKPYTLITVNDSASPVVSSPTIEIDYNILMTPTPPIPVNNPINSSATSQVTADVTSQPTIPPVRDLLVSISDVIGTGDINSEAVYIKSNADTAVQLENWTLEDADGNVYTFPNIQIIRKGIIVPLYSRSGHNTPFELYWGLTEAAWQSGETVVLKDPDGNIQATYRIP